MKKHKNDRREKEETPPGVTSMPSSIDKSKVMCAIKNFSQHLNIQQFYLESGLDRYETFNFLIHELQN